MAATLAGRAPEPDERTVSIRQACDATGVGKRTIRTWMATGKVDYVRTAGGAVRIYWWSLWRDRGGSAFSDKDGTRSVD